ncbi:PIG-L deacetylase family protein [uncultured Cohaesibacter sp.]|uniref:PIG-L deacetylase family protein n=1 Tax=uncultured Cohaesibacter sp. TaxID=1002546 RepID=UPI00292E6F80|nr:PIG-L deacetylase family protein [uncultured Cohaesibacter sp.]
MIIKDQETSGKRILVVVAHTDDETLGAGATIARHAARGDKVFGLSMTDGVGSRLATIDDHVKRRQKAAQKAADILGFEWLEAGNFPDNAMDSVPLLSIAQSIEAAKNTVMPELVYTHSAADLNIDHRITCQAVLTAFRPQPGEICTEIRSIEVPSATDYGHPTLAPPFAPNLYVDATEFIGAKLAAAEAYEEEMRPYPHCRSIQGIENLAKCRGNQVGLNYAEAFSILRKLEV